MTARSITAGAAVALALLVGACSDNTTLTANQKVAISDFKGGANAVCASANQQIVALRAQYTSQFGARAPTADEAHDFLVRSYLPLVDSLVGALHNLGEPTLDRSEWDDIMHRVDNDLVAFKSLAVQDSVKAASTIATPDTRTSTTDAAFKKFGIDECAKNV